MLIAACCLLPAITQHSKRFIELTVNQFTNTLLTAAAIWIVAWCCIVSNLRKSTGPRIFVKLGVPGPWRKIFLENLPLFREFLAFYGKRSVTVIFTKKKKTHISTLT
jgi:hypothetical protein